VSTAIDRERKKEKKAGVFVLVRSLCVFLPPGLARGVKRSLGFGNWGCGGSSFFFKHFRELLFLGLFVCLFFFPFLLLGFAHTQLSKRIQVECEKREEEEERRYCRQTEEVCPCTIYCFGRKSSKIRDVVVFASVSWSPPALEKEQNKTRKKERKKEKNTTSDAAAPDASSIPSSQLATGASLSSCSSSLQNMV
jgi:hypothetical protein